MPGLRQCEVGTLLGPNCWKQPLNACAQAPHLCELDVAIGVNVQLLHDVVEFLLRRLVAQLL